MDSGSDALATIDERMRHAVVGMERDVKKIRVGAASGALLDGVRVDHLGRRVGLDELATISIPDPRQIVIQPWDPGSLRAIGGAISRSRIGLTPTIDGGRIRLYVPALTGERRQVLEGLVRDRVERAHVEIRAIRHEALAAIRSRGRAHAVGDDEIRRATEALQRLTDRVTADIDRIGAAKAATIRRV